MQLYVFGYGSLMNPQSLARTIPSQKELTWARMRGYQRKFNVRGRSCLYLNIVRNEEMVVEGVLIPVDERELALLKARETGYACADVTTDMIDEVDGTVYAFMAPDRHHPEMKISRRYIETCLGGLDPARHEEWLKESIILNEIEEDLTEQR